GQDLVEGVHVLDAEEEDGDVEAPGPGRGRAHEVAGVALLEPALVAAALAGQPDHLGAGVDPEVLAAGLEHVEGEDAGAAADVDDPLARAQRGEAHDGGDGCLAVVGAPPHADGSVVPARDGVPARAAALHAGTISGAAAVSPLCGDRLDTACPRSIGSGQPDT